MNGGKSAGENPYDHKLEEVPYVTHVNATMNMGIDTTMVGYAGSAENKITFPQTADMDRKYTATDAKEKDTKPSSVPNKGLAMTSVPILELIMNFRSPRFPNVLPPLQNQTVPWEQLCLH